MIGIFDPVSRPKTSRNPDGYVPYPECKAYYQSRISPPFSFNICPLKANATFLSHQLLHAYKYGRVSVHDRDL